MQKKSKSTNTNLISKLSNNEEEQYTTVQTFPSSVGETKVKNTYAIYGEITEEAGIHIIPSLHNAIETEAHKQNPSPIKFFIASPGGDLSVTLDIIALFEYAKKLKVPIHTYVLSYAASAASMIAMCGHKRYVTSRSYHLIHYARIGTYSDNPDMAERNHENMKFIQDMILKIYSENANVKQLLKDKKAKSLGDLIKTDSYILYPNELIKYKFADELL